MTNSGDPKEKFREALEKKRTSNIPRGKSSDGKSKIREQNSTGNSPKMFRRKSGPS